MPKLESWQCSCGRYAELECDWPAENGGHCNKPVCIRCVRKIEGMDICPFHRGDPPDIAARKAAEAEEEARRAGQREAENAARILGIKR